jgi:short-subunit dehydrogenase
VSRGTFLCRIHFVTRLHKGNAVSFANQVAIVTGASSGIGWELAKTLAKRQCAVGVLARRQDRLEALVNEIHASGGKAAWAAADVTERQQVLDAIHGLRDALGPVDLLIANAGYGVPTFVDPINHEEIDATFKINTMGVIYAIEAVLPEMLQRGQGHLAAVSSLASYLGMPGESAYCASKAAINVYMEGLRVQLRQRGVSVTTICPGFIHTPMTAQNTFKMPFVMNADRAAEKIVRALERKKKVYNFPWQTSLLMKLACWLPDWVNERVFAGKAGVRLDKPQ